MTKRNIMVAMMAAAVVSVSGFGIEALAAPAPQTQWVCPNGNEYCQGQEYCQNNEDCTNWENRGTGHCQGGGRRGTGNGRHCNR